MKNFIILFVAVAFIVFVIRTVNAQEQWTQYTNVTL